MIDLFSVYVKYMIIELILKDIELKKELNEQNKISKRDEFSQYLKAKYGTYDSLKKQYKMTGFLMLHEEMFEYFDLLIECNKLKESSYYLNERMEFYKKKQQSYKKILITNNKINTFCKKLFSEYYYEMLKNIDGNLSNIEKYRKEMHYNPLDGVSKNIAIDFKLPVDIEKNVWTFCIDKCLIEKPRQELYIELYNYLNNVCSLSKEQISMDLEIAKKEQKKEINKKNEEIDKNNYICSIHNGEKTFNLLVSKDATAVGKSIEKLKYEIDHNENTADYSKMYVLSIYERMFKTDHPFFSETEYTKFVVRLNDNYVYYDDNDKKFHYCDYPAFFIRVEVDKDRLFEAVENIAKINITSTILKALLLLNIFLDSKNLYDKGFNITKCDEIRKEYGRCYHELLYGCSSQELSSLSFKRGLDLGDSEMEKLYRVSFTFDNYINNYKNI